MTRTCLDCPSDISDRGHRAKRCVPCAEKAAAELSARCKREWAERNPEKARECHLRYRRANVKKLSARTQKWREANPERYRSVASAQQRNWRARNPHKVIEANARRRARRKEKAGHVSTGIINSLLDSQGHTCVACKKNLQQTGYHLDHIVALSKGGKHEDENLQLLCPPCNLSKNDKDMTEWMIQNFGEKSP